MKCEIIEELLSPYLEDELSSEEKKAVEDHLKTCKSCFKLLSFLKGTIESLTDFPESDVSDNLLNKLYSIPEKKKRFKVNFDFLLRPSLQPILAGATILLTLISFYVFHPERKLINRSISRQFHLGYSKIEKLYSKAESLAENLGEYKDNILISLKNLKLSGGNED